MYVAMLVLEVAGKRVPPLDLGRFNTLNDAKQACQRQAHGVTLTWGPPKPGELSKIPQASKQGVSTVQASLTVDVTHYAFAIAGKDEPATTPKKPAPRMGTQLVVVKAWNKYVPLSGRDLLRGPSEGQAFHLARTRRWGTVKVTLCGKKVARTLKSFRPSEATCKECLRYGRIR
jgi:hypothetical protein